MAAWLLLTYFLAPAGDWADIPSTWWHVALNTRPTISVNTSFLLQDDVAEVGLVGCKL